MKTLLHTIIAVCLLAGFAGSAQAQNITFQFTSNVNYSSTLKNTMETNLSRLLNCIQQAGLHNSSIDLSGISMESNARARLIALWENCHFVCDETENIQPCLEDFEGYQVRSIPLCMKPVDDSYRGDLCRELTVSFNRRGVITGVRLALNPTNIQKIMPPSTAVTDISERLTMLKFIEDYCCFYNEKDIDALSQIFGDDALSVIRQTPQSDIRQTPQSDITISNIEVRYNKRTKERYLASLRQLFQKAKYIDVELDQIELVQNPSKEHYYGVTLHQKWSHQNTDRSVYSDDGWVFLLWDFSKPDEPGIPVRLWKPYSMQASDGDDIRIE